MVASSFFSPFVKELADEIEELAWAGLVNYNLDYIKKMSGQRMWSERKVFGTAFPVTSK